MFRLPHKAEQTEEFLHMLSYLGSHLDELGLMSFGVSDSTLEQVNTLCMSRVTLPAIVRKVPQIPMHCGDACILRDSYQSASSGLQDQRNVSLVSGAHGGTV